VIVAEEALRRCCLPFDATVVVRSENAKALFQGLSMMERTGIEPVTSGLQSRETGVTTDDASRQAATQTA